MKKIGYLFAIAGFAVLGSPGSAFAEQSSLDGFYGQLGVGMSSATPSFNNDNVAASGSRYGYTPGNINTASSFTGTATAGYNFQVNEGFLLGAGVEYSPITGHGTNYTLLSPSLGSGYTRSGTVKLQNNYNLFVSPSVAVGEDSWLYTKFGFTGAQVQLDSTTKNMNGYSLGLGYKQFIDDGWYGFSEANYFNYGSQSFSSSGVSGGSPYTFSGNNALTSYNLLIGVGYQFGGKTQSGKSWSTPSYGEDGSGLETKTGNQFGVTVSTYKYSEQSLGVRLQSTPVGVDYTGTYVINPDIFARFDARYANGTANYSGSGTVSGQPNWYYDVRGLAGTDFKVSDYVISPYSGLGYRYLLEGTSGSTTTTGAIMYQRTQSYLYIPIGATHKFAIDNKSKLETTAEFDYLIIGQNHSNTSAVNGYGTYSGYPNISVSQNTGFGLRLNSMYQQGNWSVGPYITYWNIAQSGTQTYTYNKSGTTYRATAWEPSNTTTEIGLKVGINF